MNSLVQLFFLGSCDHVLFSFQGLPCRHRIVEKITKKESLTPMDLHPQWWLVNWGELVQNAPPRNISMPETLLSLSELVIHDVADVPVLLRCIADSFHNLPGHQQTELYAFIKNASSNLNNLVQDPSSQIATKGRPKAKKKKRKVDARSPSAFEIVEQQFQDKPSVVRR